tara:strand:- start:768 stop:1001 length:234 start_codon:yes stop_codon:yes gene_type:complete
MVLINLSCGLEFVGSKGTALKEYSSCVLVLEFAEFVGDDLFNSKNSFLLNVEVSISLFNIIYIFKKKIIEADLKVFK